MRFEYVGRFEQFGRWGRFHLAWCAALFLFATSGLAADNPWDSEVLDVEVLAKAHAALSSDLKKPAEDASDEEKARYAAKQERLVLLHDLRRVVDGLRTFPTPEESKTRKTTLTAQLATQRDLPKPTETRIKSAEDIAPFETAAAESRASSKSIATELTKLREIRDEIESRLRGKAAREDELREHIAQLKNAAPDSLGLYTRENAELELRLARVLSKNATDLSTRIEAAIARAQVERDLLRLRAERASSHLEQANAQLKKIVEAEGRQKAADAQKLRKEAETASDELVKYVKQTLSGIKDIEVDIGKDENKLKELKALVTNETKKLESHHRKATRLQERVDQRSRIAATTAETLHQTLLRTEDWRTTIAQRSRPVVAREIEDLDQLLGPYQDEYWDLESDPRETARWGKLSESLRIDREEEAAKALETLFRGPNGLRDVLRKRIRGIELLQSQYEELDSIFETQSESLRELEVFIRSRIVWVRTDERLGVHIFEDAQSELAGLAEFYSDEKFVEQMRILLKRKPAFVFGSLIFLALFLAGAAVGARRVGRKQMTLGATSGRLRSVLRDALVVITHASAPSLVLLVGVALVRNTSYPDRVEFPAVASMQWVAFLLFVQRFGWGLLRENGFLAAHFKLDSAVGRQLLRSIRIFTMGGMVFYVPFHILDAAPFAISSLQRLFGTFSRITELLAVALLLPRKSPVARAFVSGSETGGRILGLLNPFFFVALALIVLMDILGYRYGAVYFAQKVIENVVVIMVIRGVYAGLSQISNWVVGRVRERAAEEHGGTAAWQDAAKVSRQLARLISVATIIVAFLFIKQSWSMGDGTVNVLKEWNVMTFADQPPLTVFNIVAASLSIVGAHFLASNIAGLFELLVFPIFGTIHRGSRYVVLALTRYIILIIGYSAALVMVHFSLSSVGWLLTAASFGLGFGLQEIIANFVSGLMMMVEQPVRVGDVISVGTTSGTVERITIRATIVTNWDQQQIIIPNKEFITKNLTNWTRNNPFTRRKIPIRVAFGSDVEKILKLLEETVKGVENVRSYPPVRIWFSGVSEYTLDFMIWAYIDVDFGFSAQSAIRRAVHAALASEGVDIPLPQTDIHLKGGEDPRESTELLGDTP